MSLFTNIPEYLVHKAEKRWTQIYNKINMSYTEFLNIIKFILNNNYFQFNEKFYHQIFGSAMANPISPIFADIVIEDMEIGSINKLNFKPAFYFRYVDDIILCIPKNIIDRTVKGRRYRFLVKKSIFFIVLNYFLALSIPKNLLLMSKFSYNYLM